MRKIDLFKKIKLNILKIRVLNENNKIARLHKKQNKVYKGLFSKVIKGLGFIHNFELYFDINKEDPNDILYSLGILSNIMNDIDDHVYSELFNHYHKIIERKADFKVDEVTMNMLYKNLIRPDMMDLENTIIAIQGLVNRIKYNDYTDEDIKTLNGFLSEFNETLTYFSEKYYKDAYIAQYNKNHSHVDESINEYYDEINDYYEGNMGV